MRPKNTCLPCPSTQRGVGLAEQIVALAVLAVLAAMAVPSFRHLIERHELRTAQADYMAALQHARNLAINEQRQIIFCPSRDGIHCSNDGSWNLGWLMGRHDLDKKGQPVGQPLFVGGRYSENIIIVGSDAKKYIAFNTDGSVAGTNQTLSFCIRGQAQPALKVVIALRGRVRGEVSNTSDTTPCATSE